MDLNYYQPADLTKATMTELCRALEQHMNEQLRGKAASWGDKHEKGRAKEIAEIQKEIERRAAKEETSR